MKAGQIDYTLEKEFTFDPDNDSDLMALIAAARATDGSTKFEFAIMDGDVTVSGETGVRGVFEVMAANRSEALAEGVMIAMTLKPSCDDEGNDPAAYTVT